TARARAVGRQVVEPKALDLQVGEPREGVAPPGTVVDLVAHRFAVLAVARHGDAGRGLAAHDVRPRLGELLLERRLVDLAGLAAGVGFDQLVGARQAAGVAGDDVVAARLHALPSLD